MDADSPSSRQGAQSGCPAFNSLSPCIIKKNLMDRQKKIGCFLKGVAWVNFELLPLSKKDRCFLTKRNCV